VVSIARIGRPPFYRGGPASTETTPATSPSPSEAARCASTEDHQAPSPPLFRGSSLFPFIGWAGRSSIARVERYKYSFHARSYPLQGWGLIDLLLRASNEGLRRPRVARAQKIIRLHPLPPLAVPTPTPYTDVIAIQPGLNSPARSFIN